MESFLVSIIVFIVAGIALGIWKHATRKRFKIEVAHLDEQIAEVAEVAQRRHKKRFGRASTDLNASFTITANGGAHRKV
jgi:hypothetical protein